MKSTRLASSLLCVLYILHLHALAADPSSHARQATGGEMQADGLMATGETATPVQKELSDTTTAGARKMMLRETKVKENEVLREEIEKQKELSGETSRISGKDANYTLKRTGKSQDQYDDQKTISESSSLGVSGKLQVSDKNAGAHHHHHHHEKDESRRLLDDAADEIVSLMRKDYRGMDKPRRKPPINNHKPTD